MKECERCGYCWISRTRNPKSCPNCKSRLWRRAREPFAEEDLPTIRSAKKVRVGTLKEQWVFGKEKRMSGSAL